VLHENGRDSYRQLGQLGHCAHDFIGYEMEPARARAELDLALNPHGSAFWRERANGHKVAEDPRTRT
jgi:hypothetical protein